MDELNSFIDLILADSKNIHFRIKWCIMNCTQSANEGTQIKHADETKAAKKLVTVQSDYDNTIDCNRKPIVFVYNSRIIKVSTYRQLRLKFDIWSVFNYN